MPEYDPDLVSEAQSTARWSALVRSDVDVATAGSWDPNLLREPRLLVPLDVQALVVGTDGGEAVVALPSPLTPGTAGDASVLDGPPPFAPGGHRPPGVHLHWALPDSLLCGELRDPRRRPGGGLGLAVLPDQWVVLRLLAPQRGTRANVRGWRLDAAAGTAVDLAGNPLALAPAHPVPPAELTGTAGGTLTWTAGYDAAFGRFAWHDPLDDVTADPQLAGGLPGGPVGGAATYLVVGWWSNPDLDPLDGVRTEGGLTERMKALGWKPVPGGGDEAADREGSLERLADLGVGVATRYQTVGGFAGGGQEAMAGDGGWAASAASAVQAVQTVGATSFVAEAASVLPGRGVGVEASALLHGAVVGVPLPSLGAALMPDLRPSGKSVEVSLGEHVDDLVSARLARRLGTGNVAARRAFERLLSAFAGRQLWRLATPEGVVDVDEREHLAGFAAVDPQEPPLVDRVRTGRAPVPSRPPRPQASAGARTVPPIIVFAPERRSFGLLEVEPSTATVARLEAIAREPTRAAPAGAGATASAGSATRASSAPRAVAPGEETIERPATRRWVPLDPLVAVSGAGRSLRHGGDGRGDPDELLACRRPSQVGRQYAGVVSAGDVLPSLGSGAVPAETLALAQEALLLSPHLGAWLAELAADRSPTIQASAAAHRIGAELALRYDTTGAYLGKSTAYSTIARGDADAVLAQTLELLRRHSTFDGVEPDLVGITSWAQPWVPLWAEWEVSVTPGRDLKGWSLGAVDLEPDPAAPDGGAGTGPPGPAPVTVSGRSPLTTGPGAALGGAISDWLEEEGKRDRDNRGESDPETEARLGLLATVAATPDLLGASLDGVRSALLGLPRTVVRARAADGTIVPPAPVALPELLVAGNVTLTRLRLVDAFGRVLPLDVSATTVPARVEVAGQPAMMQRTPRITAPTRCRLRLVGAAATAPQAAVDAVVDEIDPSHQVNPVVGFLLPDHLDESLEVFATDGSPLGELLVEVTGGGVVWEPSPGRPLPADAGPLEGLGAAQCALGLLASGMVAADARARDGRPASDPAAPAESALAAFLRAIDTTLWTVDPVAGAGSSGVGSVVGRPVAVVRAVLDLDVAVDVEDLTLDASGRDSRSRVYSELARLEVPVRIGEVTRADDGVLGWFLDDDYRRFHVVDKVVRDLALEAGRLRGHLGPWGTTPVVPNHDPITHEYLADEDTIVLHPGVPRLLTLLMLPGAAAHWTCGITPRQSLRLSRAWFAPGLERITPSVRVGPVLIDPGEVRLPTVAALGERQVLTYRDGPLSWRNDAILAATQSALLPDRPAALREGWVRVDPSPPPGPATE